MFGEDEGYTLVEMTIALLIISLGFGAALEAERILRSQQSTAVAELQAQDASESARRILKDIVSQASVDTSQGLVRGDQQAFTLSCPEGACGAHLSQGRQGVILESTEPAAAVRLDGLRAAHFAYLTDEGEQLSWTAGSDAGGRLRAIVLYGDTGRGENPVVTIQTQQLELPGCHFDVIIRVCT